MNDAVRDLAAALAGRYTIERELGRGGSATVYLAHDLKHDRAVALKVLSAELALAIGPERFLREISIAAKLNHPHIVPLLDSGETGPFLYYVMPYVQGESLRQRLGRERQLPLGEAIGVTREVADALGYAHSLGLVHRDIKPENILLSGGHAVVADFGIARAITSAADQSMTEPGTVIGTPAYMSPEQSRGGSDVDGRSDLYSLTCVLYEMLCGHPPFSGATAQETLARHLIDPVPSVRAARASVPPGLEEVIRQGLAKQPADRFATAAQFAAALLTGESRPAPGPAAAPASLWRRRSLVAVATGLLLTGALVLGGLLSRGGSGVSRAHVLVVLPFENLGPPDQEYFADGLTQEITARLAGLSGLGVISRTSASQYRKTTKPMREIGRELGVDYVLEGSVRWETARDGRRQVRITPQLIRVADDTHVWAHHYQETLSDVFAVQAGIANGVAAALDVALLSSERRRLDAKPTDNLDAYDFFLRGNAALNRSYREADLRQAIEMFTRATALDSGFALAWARLSRARAELYWAFFYDHSEALAGEVRAAADRALALVPDLPEGHLALGYYHYYARLDYARALEQFGIAARAEPNNGDIAEATAYILRRQGKWRDAVESMQKAVALDPRAHGKIFWLGHMYTWMGRYPEAEQLLEQARALNPAQADIAVAQALLYLGWRGDRERARDALSRGAEQADPAALVHAGLLTSAGLSLRVLPDAFGQVLGRLSARSFGTAPELYFLSQAMVLGASGLADRARASYDSARAALEPKAAGDQRRHYYHMLLGLARAGGGRGADALRETQRAAELLPLSIDAANGNDLQLWIAQTWLLAGEQSRALEKLGEVLGRPHWITPRALALDPLWEPLRDDARFQGLLRLRR